MHFMSGKNTEGQNDGLQSKTRQDLVSEKVDFSFAFQMSTRLKL